MNGQPKAPFYAALFLVVAGCWPLPCIAAIFLPRKEKFKRAAGAIDPNVLGQTAEDKDSATVTTVKEYSFKPAERLPDVKGTSAYKPLNRQHGAVRTQRVGRLGADHFGQRRLQAGQGLEDGQRRRISRSSSCSSTIR